MKSYIPLHDHSCFSILDGTMQPKMMAEWAQSNNCPAFGISDHGSLAGIPDFYKSCKKSGIKPLLGCEFYIVHDHKDKHIFRTPSGKNSQTGYHLTVFAQNLKGFQNLIHLNNAAHLEGFFYSPKIDFDLLEKYNEGLIILSGCPSSEVGQNILGDSDPGKVIKRFLDVFEKRYFLEIMDNGMQIDMQRTINEYLIKIAKSFDLKLVPTNDAHYIRAEDRKIHDIVLCMKSKKVLSDPKRFKYDGLYHIKSVEEMEKIFPEYMKNTLEVADMVENFDIYDKNMKLPISVQDPVQALKTMANSGLVKRNLGNDAYEKRLNRELEVIEQMGFSAYLLSIKEIVDLIRSNNCPLGWGRGSASGSLVCYCLGITEVDPIKYNLLFERFISEHRPDWPDIDIDISREQRDKIIEALMAKYGQDKVAHISVYAGLKPKILIRDICRVMEQPMTISDKLSGMVPMGANDYEDLKGSEVEKMLEESEEGRGMLDTWKGLMGLPRHAGMHASGLVVSSESLVEHLPLRQEEGRTILQYTMHHINDFGFIKFDLLGVETLDTIFETAKEVGINIKEIPLDDKEVYEMIGRGQVTGLFQLDASKTCIDICKRFKPQNIRDIADIMALNRPGILDADLLETYLRRRSGHEKVTFLHPDLEKILEPTFGICLYQEDLMRMAAAYAGYTPLEVEDLRKGIGKKDMAIIDKHVAIFREKARTLGRDPKEIETVLEQVEAAGRYSFNASHALSYSLVSYACGYLAVHYPLNFFKNLINHSNKEERRSYLSQMLMRKLPLLPPDINVSEPNISIEKEAMRLGLLLIEGIGPAHVKTIMEHRPYSSIKEVSVRLSKSLVALLYAAHALDSLPDIGTYHPLVKLDEVEILGIPLSGLKGEFEDVINFISPVSIADVTDVDTCLIKVTDFKKHVQKDGKTMLFIQGFDVFGPKIESLMLFGNTLEKLTIKVEKNKVYGMLIRKLSGSGYCVNDLNSVENIRKLIDVQKND